MPLIDLITDISSFDYKKVGEKQGEYFGEKNATGFTPNRKAGDTTEYNDKSIFNDGLDTQIKTGVDYIDNINATGYTTNRTTKDIGTDSATFAGEYKIGTSEYDGLKSTNFVKGAPAGVNYSVNQSFVQKVNTEVNSNSEYSDFPLDKTTDGSLQLLSTDLSVLTKARANPYNQNTKDDQNKFDSADLNSVKEIHISDIHPKSTLPIKKSLFERYDEIKSDIYTKFGGNLGLRPNHPDNPGDANVAGVNFISSQPFIIKDINEGYGDSIRFDEGIARGGFLLNGVRVGEDIERLTKFAASSKGLLFATKQVALQKGFPDLGVPGNARKETRNFNPAGIFGSVVPGVHLPRHFGQKTTVPKTPLEQVIETISGDPAEPSRYNDANNPPDSQYHVDNNKGGVYKNINNPVFTSDIMSPFMRSREDNKNESFDLNPDSNIKPAGEFGLGSGYVRTSNGNLYAVGASNQLQLPYGGKYGKINEDFKGDPLPKDFVKFKIRDGVNGKWIVFPAHLGSVTDTVSPEWSTERYIGRPDSVHIYAGANRNVSFEFKVAAFTKQEIPIIQEKMNALVGLGYPTYKKTFTQDDEVRPVAPYIYLTIGDLYNNTPGYFNNISLTFEENSTWEIDDGLQIPHYFSVSVEFIHIGKFVPTTISKHFDFPNLQQHDIQYGVFKGDPREKDRTRPQLGDISPLYRVGKWMGDEVGGRVQEKQNKVVEAIRTNAENGFNELKSSGQNKVTELLDQGEAALSDIFNFG